MLRIIQQSNARAAKSYYSQADYFIEGQELAGEWGGKAAARLGLKGEVRKADFDALCDNENPRTGRSLTKRTRSDRTVLYDFNWHVPKSVSLAYELGRDDRILDAFRDSVRETMSDIEAEMKVRVRKRGDDSERVTGNLAYANWVHFTSRPAKEDGLPDPHLHCHSTVMNLSYDSAEKQWKAGYFRDLKRDAPYWEAAFHARFAKQLNDLGYHTVRTKTGWEIEGFSPALLRQFSRRTAEIEALAERLGIKDDHEKEKLGATSRSKKVSASHADLREYWESRLTDRDRHEAAAVLERAASGPCPPDLSPADALQFAISDGFERAAVVPHKRLMASALDFGVGSVRPEEIAAESERQGVLTRTFDGQVMATTREVLEEESRMVAFAREGKGSVRPLNPNRTIQREWLSDDQKAAVRHIWGSPDRVLLVRGVAGTGKTTMMEEAVAGIDRPVVALAPTAAGSRGVLRESGFKTADTVQQFLIDDDFRESARGGVVWVDEASLLGSRTLVQLFDAAEQIDARVILQGDVAQHASVERGSPLRLLQDHAGLKAVELTEIRRQSGDYRQAIESLANGRTLEGFDQLDRLGWIVELPDDERYAAIAREYVSAIGRGESALIVAPTHAEIALTTDAVRQAQRQAGQLGESRTLTQLTSANLTEAERGDPLQYSPGDVLQFHKPAESHPSGTRIVVADDVASLLDQADRFQVYHSSTVELAIGDTIRMTANGKTVDQKHRFHNGTRYTVAGFDSSGNVRLSNGWTVSKDWGHWTHGVAVTSHASQGASVDRVFVAESAVSFGAANQAQFYVSLSRGKKSATVFTSDKESLRRAVRRADSRLAASDLMRVETRLTSRRSLWKKTVDRVRTTLEQARDAIRGLLQEKEPAYDR